MFQYLFGQLSILPIIMLHCADNECYNSWRSKAITSVFVKQETIS